MNTNTKLLDSSLKAMEDCGEMLGRISASCCMPGRSVKIKETFDQMRNASDNIRKATIDTRNGRSENHAALTDAVEQITQAGGKIGNLNVSCCTEVREPMYRHILLQLNQVHRELNAAMGFSH